MSALTLNPDLCRQCHSAFCSCQVPHVTPGQEVLAPFGFGAGHHTRGAWGHRAMLRAVVRKVQTTPTGTWVTVEARGRKRRVRLESLRAVEGLVEGAEA